MIQNIHVTQWHGKFTSQKHLPRISSYDFLKLFEGIICLIFYANHNICDNHIITFLWSFINTGYNVSLVLLVGLTFSSI